MCYLCNHNYNYHFKKNEIMNKTCVIYGSSTGTCEDIAKRIGAKLGLSDDAIIDVANLKAEDVADCRLV